jgi:hypothetical protein
LRVSIDTETIVWTKNGDGASAFARRLHINNRPKTTGIALLRTRNIIFAKGALREITALLFAGADSPNLNSSA